MADKTDITVDDAMRAAWQSLLEGDTASRDSLCALVERQMGSRNTVPRNEVICLGDQSKNNS